MEGNLTEEKEDNSTNSKKKRKILLNKAKKACYHCKRSHRKCDDHRPCENCKRYNLKCYDTRKKLPHELNLPTQKNNNIISQNFSNNRMMGEIGYILPGNFAPPNHHPINQQSTFNFIQNASNQRNENKKPRMEMIPIKKIEKKNNLFFNCEDKLIQIQFAIKIIFLLQKWEHPTSSI